MEIISQIFNDAFWYMAPILVTLTTALTGLINQGFKVSSSVWKQIISWVMGAGLSCGSIALGLLGDNIGWASYVALSFVVGLGSNGIYDIKVIRNWIDTWFTTKEPEV